MYEESEGKTVKKKGLHGFDSLYSGNLWSRIADGVLPTLSDDIVHLSLYCLKTIKKSRLELSS